MVSITVLFALVFAGTDFFRGDSGSYGLPALQGRPRSRRRGRAGRTGATHCIIVRTTLLRSEQFGLGIELSLALFLLFRGIVDIDSRCLPRLLPAPCLTSCIYPCLTSWNLSSDPDMKVESDVLIYFHYEDTKRKFSDSAH